MARKKLTMRQIQEVLRLKYQNQLAIREIARSCGLPTSTVGDYLQRAEAAKISWPLPEGQGEKELPSGKNLKLKMVDECPGIVATS